MYKDKDKQRQAQRERTRRYRDKAKGVTSEGVTGQGVTQSVTIPCTGGASGIPTPLPPDNELFAGLPEQLLTYANGELGGDWYRQQIRWLKTTPIEQIEINWNRPFIPAWRRNLGAEA